MKILVDADACPVKDIIVRIAKSQDIPVIMIIDTAHELNDGYSTVITVDQGRDSANLAIMKQLAKTDIVVTQDFGLAALVLGKGARAINQNGLVYTDANIERLLFERFLGQKVRRSGGRTNNPKKRTKEDNERFEAAFVRIIEEK
ncbi:YaiI/YqxD family protein [Dehalobacter sp. DCM]|uniref:YaiI/YqxD family protein n=1 Tax=Dehalobacter sp. DCM TaxID=2907827 RepID=UPI0030813395|nr:YaiI/YqxD family protein [Dehalobacter sp. DCM]